MCSLMMEKMTPRKMASKHYRDFTFLLANMHLFRPTLYKQTNFTVYRSTFSTNKLLWLCVQRFLETQIYKSERGQQETEHAVCLLYTQVCVGHGQLMTDSKYVSELAFG